MMLLLFKINNERYGLDVADVVELVPYVKLQNLPKAPVYIAGLMNYRGNIVPVVDLAMLMCDRPVRRLMSSRIIIIRSAKSEKRYVGLLAENVTETIKISPETFTDTGIDPDASAFVDKVAMRPEGMIHLVNITKLLPSEVGSMLYNQMEDIAAEKENSDVI